MPRARRQGAGGYASVSAHSDGVPYVMTIGWAQLGIVCGKPIMSVLVRPSRFTHDRAADEPA